MFDTFHEKCPNAKFVVMSGLLLPGRSEYRELTQMVNDELEEYCNTKDYMYFVDSEDMTYQNGEYREDLFIKDGIHLNHAEQRARVTVSRLICQLSQKRVTLMP